MALETEPDNPHDADAVKVSFEYQEGKFFHLGYIPNANTICDNCGHVMERHPQSGACPECGIKGRLARYGTATRISGIFKEFADKEVPVAYLEEVTGGNDGKSYGANISIHTD